MVDSNGDKSELDAIIHVHRDAGVDLVTLARPPANALDPTLIAALGSYIDQCTQDPPVALVITGTGKRFAVGADIGYIQNVSGQQEFIAFVRRVQQLFGTIESLPFPTLAAINGDTVGGGLELALSCDIRVASERARFALPEAQLGLIPGAGGTQRLAEVIGKSMALELMYSGRLIDATEAHALGLVRHVVPDNEVVQRAIDMAKDLTRGAPGALASVKTCVIAGIREGRAVGFDLELTETAKLFGSADTREGVAAFIEKRPADFPSRRTT